MLKLFDSFAGYGGAHYAIKKAKIKFEAVGFSENDPFALLILLQNNLIDGNGQIDFQNVYDYTEREAQEAFARVANHHGWTVKHQKS